MDEMNSDRLNLDKLAEEATELSLAIQQARNHPSKESITVEMIEEAADLEIRLEWFKHRLEDDGLMGKYLQSMSAKMKRIHARYEKKSKTYNQSFE
ncbi:MAG TPA: hypothetical protein DCY51_03115 [Bacteroidetes bacterium]|nr:hypothetical protein [Bacteroidota bacterium]